MKIQTEMPLAAAALVGLLVLPAALPGAAYAADSDGNSTMDSMKQGAGDAAEAVKNGAESAGHAVKKGASSAYGTVKDTVTGSSSTANLPEPDRDFVQKAAIPGMFEVKAAK